jgi:hypothetical protein
LLDDLEVERAENDNSDSGWLIESKYRDRKPGWLYKGGLRQVSMPLYAQQIATECCGYRIQDYRYI